MAQFGKPLNITQYGFYSISEMLAAATDFIIMQQSRTGSQLLLKNAAMPQNQIKNLMSSLSKPCMYMIMEFLERLISCSFFFYFDSSLLFMYFHDDYSAVESKQKPVSSKTTLLPERNQQDSHSHPAVPKPEPVKAEHSLEENIFKVWVFV